FAVNRVFGSNVTVPVEFPSGFDDLGKALSAARSHAPIPSASGAFRFAWDPEVHTFVRTEQSLGSMVAERVETLGRNTVTLNTSYTRVDFDTFNGDSLSFHSITPIVAGTSALDSTIRFQLAYDLIYVTTAYGLTDSIDVSASLA